MEAMIVITLAFFIGLIVGFSFKGIHIHHHQEKEEEKQGYNESTAHLMNEDMKAYFDKNNGMRDY